MFYTNFYSDRNLFIKKLYFFGLNNKKCGEFSNVLKASENPPHFTVERHKS
ncbi:exonuclease III [Aggregatibacter aphrophilus NJ8700]|nr:exonuclease III [Aggregatibacter aphrophilus NJ8700]